MATELTSSYSKSCNLITCCKTLISSNELWRAYEEFGTEFFLGLLFYFFLSGAEANKIVFKKSPNLLRLRISSTVNWYSAAEIKRAITDQEIKKNSCPKSGLIFQAKKYFCPHLSPLTQPKIWKFMDIKKGFSAERKGASLTRGDGYLI